MLLQVHGVSLQEEIQNLIKGAGPLIGTELQMGQPGNKRRFTEGQGRQASGGGINPLQFGFDRFQVLFCLFNLSAS